MRSAEGRRPEAAKKDERRDEGSWGEGGGQRMFGTWHRNPLREKRESEIH